MSIAWKSNKLQQVAHSTLAAETLAFTDGCDAAYTLLKMAKEANLVKEDFVISTFTDNKSLFDSSNTTTQVIEDSELNWQPS